MEAGKAGENGDICNTENNVKNLCVETLTPSELVFEDKVFGRCFWVEMT